MLEFSFFIFLNHAQSDKLKRLKRPEKTARGTLIWRISASVSDMQLANTMSRASQRHEHGSGNMALCSSVLLDLLHSLMRLDGCFACSLMAHHVRVCKEEKRHQRMLAKRRR